MILWKKETNLSITPRISMHELNVIKIHPLFLKNEILTSIKSHNSVEKFRKISCASHNTAYTKFHQNPSICSQDIKWKQNSDIKKRKIICSCPYLHFVCINAFTKFYQNPSIGPQNIEHKQNFNINQGP